MTYLQMTNTDIPVDLAKADASTSSEHRLQAIFQAFPDLLFHLKQDGTILDYKSGKAASLYVPPEVFLGRKMQQVLPLDVGIQFSKALRRVNQTGEVVSIEYSLSVPEGERNFEARFVRLPEREIIIVIRDITGQKQAEKKLEQQFQQLAALRDIDTTLASDFDLKRTMRVVLQQSMKQLGADAADILLINPHTHNLEYVDGTGFQGSALQQLRLLPEDNDESRAVFEQRTIVQTRLPGQLVGSVRTSLFLREKFKTYIAAPLICDNKVKGVLEVFYRSPFDPDPDWMSFFTTLAGQASIAIGNANLFHDLQHSNMEMTMAYELMIEGWAHALDLRDQGSEGHSQRVTGLTVSLASLMDVPENDLSHIRRGALLHDLGKIGIPDSILRKPGRLTSAEWKIMKQHPQYAYDLLQPIPYLHPAIDIPLNHHEKWDGSGYPGGLKGESIPLAARIFAVADVYDALTCNRLYRPAWSKEKAFKYICSRGGTHFDPGIIQLIRQLGNDGFLGI